MKPFKRGKRGGGGVDFIVFSALVFKLEAPETVLLCEPFVFLSGMWFFFVVWSKRKRVC